MGENWLRARDPYASESPSTVTSGRIGRRSVVLFVKTNCYGMDVRPCTADARTGIERVNIDLSSG